MRYIKVAQFEEQSKEVQQVFLEWWVPKIGDLSYSKKYGMAVLGPNDLLLIEDDEVFKRFKEYNIPLFTLQQLWEFIRARYKYIEVDNFCQKYKVSAYKELSQINASVLGFNEDLLQAFWKCACEVARVME